MALFVGWMVPKSALCKPKILTKAIQDTLDHGTVASLEEGRIDTDLHCSKRTP